MSAITNVALVGANGSLGPSILAALLAADFNVTVLTRGSSSATFPSNVKVVKTDYNSLSDITSAFIGIDAVISLVGSAALSSQTLLIDAAITAGVKRFLPSDFGSDLANPKTRALPVFAAKIAVEKYLEAKATAHPAFTYTLFRNSAFFDWGLDAGFIFDPRSATPVIYSPGTKGFSVTTLATIGEGVAAVLKKPEETKNRAVHVQDAVISQNQLLHIANKIDPETKREPLVLSIERVLKEANEKAAQGNFDLNVAYDMIKASVFIEGYGSPFASVDNKLLGIENKDSSFVEDVVRKVLQK